MKKKIGIVLALIAIVTITIAIYSYLNRKNNGNNITSQNKEEEISIEKEEIKDLLIYIQNDKFYKYDDDYLINIYYSNKKISVDEIPNYNKIDFSIVSYYLNSGNDICQVKNKEITSEEVELYVKKVYGPDVVYEEVEEGTVFNFEDGKYLLKNTICDEESPLLEDNVKTIIIKALKNDNEIKIYQKMAYIFKRTRTNEDQSKQEYYTFLTGFDVSGIPVYSDVPLEEVDLKNINTDDFNTYIYTFKKASDGKYYFSSVEPAASNKPQKIYEE